MEIVCRTNSYFHLISFDKCHFFGRVFITDINFRNPIEFKKSTFNDILWVDAKLDPTGYYEQLVIDSCHLRSAQVTLSSAKPIKVLLVNNISTDTAQVSISVDNVSDASISGNRMQGKLFEVGFKEIDVLKFDDNDFQNILIRSTNVKSEFDFQRKEASNKLVLYRTYFSQEPANDVDWASLDSMRLCFLNVYETSGQIDREAGQIRYDPQSLLFISGENQNDISNDVSFRHLMGMYSMFLNL